MPDEIIEQEDGTFLNLTTGEVTGTPKEKEPEQIKDPFKQSDDPPAPETLEEKVTEDVTFHVGSSQIKVTGSEHRRYLDLVREVEVARRDRNVSEISMADGYWDAKSKLNSYLSTLKK